MRTVVDSLTSAERSARMSRIGGRNTSPEIALRKALHRLGLRFRLHTRALPGKPDLVFPKYKAIVFVHGCFWHRHAGCKIATTPKSNTEFWIEKFNKNVLRDAKVSQSLFDMGWRIFVAWECELSSAAKTEATASRLAEQIRQ